MRAAAPPVSIALTVAGDDPCFRGHFPGEPTLAASAQLALVVLPKVESHWPDLATPREVRRLKLHAAIRPGDALTLTLTRDAGEISFELHRAGTLCTSGVLAR